MGSSVFVKHKHRASAEASVSLIHNIKIFLRQEIYNKNRTAADHTIYGISVFNQN